MKNIKKFVQIGLTGIITGCNPQDINLEGNLSKEVEISQSIEDTTYQETRRQVRQQIQRDYRTTNFFQDTDEVILARMIFGEARNCTERERIAVGYTAFNRLRQPTRFGRTLSQVILRPSQYSCFNRNDPNREQLMDPQRYDSRSFEECLEVAMRIISGVYEDPTQGATHYFNPRVVRPSWANRMTKIGIIGNSKHEFYRED